MKFIIIFVSIVSFCWPLIDLVLLSSTVRFFEKISPELSNVKKRIGIEPIQTIRQALSPILPNNITIDDAQKRKEYNKRFFWIVEYAFSGPVLLIVDIVFLCISISRRTDEQIAYCIIIFAMNLLFLWGLKLSPLCHYIGLNRFANVIDKVVFDITSSKGKINENITDFGIKMATYLVGMLGFGLYMCLYKQIEDMFSINGFFSIFLALMIYHFVINWLFAKVVGGVSRKISFVHEVTKNQKYLYDSCKTTSYIVFLTFYLIIKIVQSESGVSDYNIVLVEAVGALFLLDTYFDKMKVIKDNEMELCGENKKEVKEAEKEMENIDINVNTIEKTEPLPVKGTVEVDVDDTAIKEYFEIVNIEYQNERNKKQSFESRAGLLLTLLSAICIFYFQSIKIKDVVLLFNQTLTFALLIKIISGIMIYVLFVLTFIAIIKTIATKRHNNFDVNNINEALLAEKKMDALARLIFTYCTIIKQHREINESRAKWYKIALCCTFGLLIATIIFTSL